MTPSAHKNGHLSPRACLALGSIAGAVGLAASGVATWFYVLGLIELEPSGTARTALITAGVLLTLGQLAAFGIAATAHGELPAGLRRGLQGLGLALFLFETGSMAITQLALVQSADAVASASIARVGELQRAIDERRATAAGQRALAETQGVAQAITAAARSLRAADAAEAAIAPLAAELAQLQAARRPTLSTVLGDEQRVALFATARAALIALVGLVMTSTAGALLSREHGLPAQPADGYLATTGKRHTSGALPDVRQASKASSCGCNRLPAAAPTSSAPSTAPNRPRRFFSHRISEMARSALASISARNTVSGPNDIEDSPIAHRGVSCIETKIVKPMPTSPPGKTGHLKASFRRWSLWQRSEAGLNQSAIAERSRVSDA
jgi:hypothetical protein